MQTQNFNITEHGFEEVSIDQGMTNGMAASAGCSGARSDCCTRVCSHDGNFAASEEAWEQFLKVEGGQVQY